MDTRISVIIPTYNRKQIVIEAINSVLRQEPKNYEVIVVDDGSTDGTREFLNSLNLAIRVIRKENGGVASARNEGIKNAKGEYIAFLDSDDLWLPEKLNLQLKYLLDHPNIALVYTDGYIWEKGKILENTRFQRSNTSSRSRLLYPAFVDYTPICIDSVMVRKSTLKEVGSFNELLSIHEDSELWNRVSETYELGFIDRPLFISRFEVDHEHLMNETSKKKFIEEGKKYLKIYKQRRKNRSLTSEEERAIKESYVIVQELEKDLSLNPEPKLPKNN